MEKKIVFFDIDGTLYNDQKEIPKTTVQAIEKLKSNGVDVVIATGRAPFMFEELRNQLNVSSFVSINGSYVVFNGEVVYTRALEQAKLQQLEEEANKLNHPLVYVHHNHHYSNQQNHPFIKESIGDLKIIEPKYNPDFFRTEEVYQALLFCEDESHYVTNHQDFDYIRWHRYSIDVIPSGGSKAKGVEVLLDKLGIPKGNAYAFGDALNDIEMLQYVGTGVAMGNGCAEVKSVANYITKSVDEDGIHHGLQHFGLI
ncbi:Cof-type HAD-IIB family hydrolase [Alkalihalobacillus sp. LMS39]|uniref:Cof-type HAD-IIB family hydrolase n=1 Tax=Alkalihalobacillus sp. LMS39 TaxID=2924032 RepID=UPI001FB3F813|nr:Cof-type HAD-IIB family hydrolase [Alkalihalobacillus sp. LMS39]UOE96491.1 Cof-type HAD-IIB family hydrolase [Alkalihalobacillus sp. LMS39]